MKKWIGRITILVCIIVILAAVIGVCSYQRLIEDVQIIQYFDSVADNLNWQTVYVRVVVPKEQYKKGWTENAIRVYIIIRSKNIPNRIDIVIYGSMEALKECEEYARESFRK